MQAKFKQRKLGKNGPLVSEIGFGGGALSGEGGGYGFGRIDEGQAQELVLTAFELGINLFDTAPIYGFGTSEQRLGMAIKNIREKVIIVSKCGVDWHNTKRVNRTNDPKVTERMLEESLRRLQSEYIDVYMIHWPDPMVDIRHPMEVLAKAQRQGKIRQIGLCNTNQEDYLKASEVASIEVLQEEYNLIKPKEKLWPLINQYELGLMTWGTLEKGIITGSVKKGRRFEENGLSLACTLVEGLSY